MMLEEESVPVRPRPGSLPRDEKTPWWEPSAASSLLPGRRGDGKQQQILVFSHLPVLLHPSPKSLVAAGNSNGGRAGDEVLAKGSAGSGQDPVYFSVKDIVVSYGFPSR